MKKYYKIVELKGNDIYTLFHGIGGTRLLKTDKWLTAERKENVQDGRGTKYTSGIHIIDGLEECLIYLKRFKRTDRVIVECYAKGLRPKEHSPSKVLLADKIKIIPNKIYKTA